MDHRANAVAQVATDVESITTLLHLTIDLGKSTGGDQGIVVDALKDVLVQLLGLWTVKRHA